MVSLISTVAGASYATITGNGTIEGDGALWWAAVTGNGSPVPTIGTDLLRPVMVFLNTCTYSTVSGITIHDAPNVHIVAKYGSHNTIASVTISSPGDSVNTDGIDVWENDLAIHDCTIACGDDNIAIDSPCYNVSVTNCAFGVGHGCSMGSYVSKNGVGDSNITVDTCSFNGTGTGMHLKSCTGRAGVVTGVSYSNLYMTGVTWPVLIDSLYGTSVRSDGSVSTATAADMLLAANSDTTTTATDVTAPVWSQVTASNILAVNSGCAISLRGTQGEFIDAMTFAIFGSSIILATASTVICF